MSVRDIERLNIYDFLRLYEKKIRDIFEREGTAAARRYIYRVHRIRMRGWEVREFLGMPKNEGAIVAREIHRMAWSHAGWNGNYSPLALGSMSDIKRLNLLAADLVQPGEKICII